MKKLALALIVALGLSGCASVQKVLQGAEYATASINNPVTPRMLYNAENAVIIVFAGLNAYKQSCAQGLVGAGCKAVVAKVQTYTRKLPPLLTNLRIFVKNNDQVNAIVMFNTLTQVVTDVKAVALANSVPMGGQ